MGFTKDDPYPLLIIDSASPVIPSVDVAGSDEILQFFEREGFIGSYKSFSAKEVQTLEDFLKPVVAPYA